MNTFRKVHVLKTLSRFLDPIGNLDKTFEVRKNDRGFQVGDILHLREWLPPGKWGPRNITCFVTYILEGPAFGIAKGYCVMAIKMPANHVWPPEA